MKKTAELKLLAQLEVAGLNAQIETLSRDLEHLRLEKKASDSASDEDLRTIQKELLALK